MQDTTPTTADNPETPSTPSTPPAPSTPLRISEDSLPLLRAMTGRLGLWETQTEAALFLAALAVAEGQEPVPEDELGEDLVELGTLAEAIEELDQRDQLALLGLARGTERSLEDVLEEDLTGLIEAGVAILRPRIAGKDAAEATGELVELLREHA